MKKEGSALHFVRLGKGGIPLVMIHGFGNTLENLRPLAELLSDTREVILIDLPGFGNSPPLDSAVSAEDFAALLKDFLDKEAIAKIDIAGHSFGGKVGMMFSSLYPDRIRKLVLIATSGLRRKRTLTQSLRFHSVKTLGKAVKLFDKLSGKHLFKSWFAPQFGSSDYNLFPHVRNILVRSVNENVDDKIFKIKTPTLILFGGRDQETPPEMGHRLNRMIRQSQLVIYPTLDHRPFEDVGRHLMQKHIHQFLEDFSLVRK
ncbi:alpha/beta fold hydrolase [Estrella lausannensis]|uniref:Alpha/beta hydrolase domain-containing protein n=1 Tax=Estrella lausannensis TaxID=483423 RepID=A0A0H5DRT5_9BACT|nr:alpha/beta hydrolase [Estrella lausannensis]CRX39327.1 Alpha/beta hydrolase domain-containing protein [Estrella lausannensis]